jgi:hypothetical protein
MTRALSWWPFFKLFIPAFAAWAAIEVALYAGVGLLIEGGLK